MSGISLPTPVWVAFELLLAQKKSTTAPEGFPVNRHFLCAFLQGRAEWSDSPLLHIPAFSGHFLETRVFHGKYLVLLVEGRHDTLKNMVFGVGGLYQFLRWRPFGFVEGKAATNRRPDSSLGQGQHLFWFNSDVCFALLKPVGCSSGYPAREGQSCFFWWKVKPGMQFEVCR